MHARRGGRLVPPLQRLLLVRVRRRARTTPQSLPLPVPDEPRVGLLHKRAAACAVPLATGALSPASASHPGGFDLRPGSARARCARTR